MGTWKRRTLHGTRVYTRRERGCIANVMGGSWQVVTKRGHETIGDERTNAKRLAVLEARVDTFLPVEGQRPPATFGPRDS